MRSGRRSNPSGTRNYVPSHPLVPGFTAGSVAPRGGFTFPNVLHTMSMFVEEAESVVRAHPLAAFGTALAFYMVISWFFLGPNLVCPYSPEVDLIRAILSVSM